MKIRLVFEKNIRYISHLELMRGIQKILKRSGLSLRYSEGFNPHIVLSIAAPLPVGVCGRQEFADFEIKDDFTKSEVLEKLISASDSSLKPKDVFIDCKKSFNDVTYAEYKIDILTDEKDKIEEFFSREEIMTEKKAKGKIKLINLKEYIHTAVFSEIEGGVSARCVLACGNEKNLNPMLIRKTMKAEGIKLEIFNALRLGIYDKNMNGFTE